MNTATWMCALDGIDDDLIEECTVVSPIREHFPTIDWRRTAAIAVTCACIAMCAVSLWILVKQAKFSMGRMNVSVGITADAVEVMETKFVYASEKTDVSAELGKAPAGTISMTAMLQKTIQAYSDADCVFAVEVLTKPETERKQLYQELFLNMELDEESFLQTGVVFMTKKQIMLLQCPEDLAVLLHLAVKQ